AFTFRHCPSSVTPIGAITGTYPRSHSTFSSRLSTLTTSPTSPNRGSRTAAISSRPSAPHSPIARPPSAPICATSSLLMSPRMTMRATSRASASVWRSPSTNRVSLPIRPSHSVIIGPPPWTSIGRIPAAWSQTSSCSTVSPGPTLPPSFSTTGLPTRRCSTGSAAASARAISSPPTAGCPRLAPVAGLVARSALIARPSLRRVFAVDGHVALGEIASPRRGSGLADVQVRVEPHFRRPQRGAGGRRIEGHRAAAPRDGDFADVHVDRLRVEVHPAAAQRRQESAPARVRTVHGRLDQVRPGDGARGPTRLRNVARTGHHHLDEPRRPLAVGSDRARELCAYPIQGRAHAGGFRVRELPGAGGAVGEQQPHVVRAG